MATHLDPTGSRAGSRAGSYAGSRAGSRAGSYAGSYADFSTHCRDLPRRGSYRARMQGFC